MNKKMISAIITVVFLGISGYYFFQNASGNTDLMLTYIEETNHLTDNYNLLLYEEELIDTEEELVTFTEKVLLPSLDSIIAEAKQYGDSIENDKLKEVHNLHVQALELRLQADQAWLEGAEAEALYVESDTFYEKYESNLNSLARQWGVEIEWEETENEE
ncbi:hypothetical protein [Alkalihalobacterium alkalinitrilicum]|uniref:hypothetical protein n=1 Tax=Alkalihalobacterium alkalinitrilicum TaxID=427920 RepID=UPI000994D31E|nr:hypothetical protein [Alkalihalobacterium alkalinitrilicum]